MCSTQLLPYSAQIIQCNITPLTTHCDGYGYAFDTCVLGNCHVLDTCYDGSCIDTLSYKLSSITNDTKFYGYTNVDSTVSKHMVQPKRTFSAIVVKCQLYDMFSIRGHGYCESITRCNTAIDCAIIVSDLFKNVILSTTLFIGYSNINEI